jgi:hypothetical protein
MTTFSHEKLGDIPLGLFPHHREFMRRLKDAINALIVEVISQSTIVTALTFVSDVPSSIIALGAGDTLTATHKTMPVVGNSGAVVLTSTPSISPGSFDGQILVVEGTDDTNLVTLQDESVLTNSGLKHQGGFNMTLGKGDSIAYRWWAIDSLWKERSRADV